MNFNQPALLLLVSSLLSIFISVYVGRKAWSRAGKYVLGILLAATIWSVFYGLELASVNYRLMEVYNILSYFGIATLPVFWLLFAAEYSGFDHWLGKKNIIYLFIIPTITFLMVLTNSWHHLYYTHIEYTTNEYLYFRKLTSGPFWYLHILYSYILVVWGFVLMIRIFMQVSGANRIRTSIIIAGGLLPYIVNVMYVFGLRPYGFLDITPIGFIAMGVFLAIGVFTVRIFDITPVAKDLLFSSIPDAIFVLDDKKQIVNMNPHAENLLVDILPGNSYKRKQLPIALPDELSPGMKTTDDVYIGDRCYHCMISPIRSKQGKQIGQIIILHDITTRINAEKALQTKADLQKLIMKMASEYINLNLEDLDKTINESLEQIGRYVNAERAYIFDYDWDANTCSNTYEWCEEGISPEIDNLQDVPLHAIPEWVRKHKMNESLDIPSVDQLVDNDPVKEILQPQGIKSLITIPVMDQQECMGFIGFDFVKDYHQHKEEEKSLLIVFAQIFVNLRNKINLEKRIISEREKANHANKAKSEFLANISHEIRTPMNSILGFSEVMLNTTDNEEQKNYLKTILNSGKTLLSLINDILDLSKIEAGKIEISPEPTNLRLIIEEISKLFIPKAKENNLAFLIDIEPNFPSSIIIDEIRLRQILLNLMGNAMKFTKQGYVRLKVQTDHVHENVMDFTIHVEDTGIGISRENQEKIFDSFSQTYGQDNRKYGGTGLGLSICKRLCELMQGTVTVDSEPGKGSTFSISFSNIAFSDDSVKQKDDFVWKGKNLVFGDHKILIVDDVRHNRQLIVTYLKEYNLTLYEVENGQMAIEAAKAYNPDLVFMDIRMPGMNGYEATEKIKKQPETKDIPVVALTASTMLNEMERINGLFDGYLRKPVQKNYIINELTRHLSHQLLEENVPENDNPTVENVSIDEEMVQYYKNGIQDLLKRQIQFTILGELQDVLEYLVNFTKKYPHTIIQSHVKELKYFIDEFDMDRVQKKLVEINSEFEKAKH